MSTRLIKIELTPGSKLAIARFIARSRRRSPAQRRLASVFAAKRVAHRHRPNLLAFGEDPGIFPLARMDRTQLIWPCPPPSEPLMVRFRSPGVVRWLHLLFVQEGTPLCN